MFKTLPTMFVAFFGMICGAEAWIQQSRSVSMTGRADRTMLRADSNEDYFKEAASSFSSSSSSSSSSTKLPKLIVFDLDGCLWKPEMYELKWSTGGGSPFKLSGDGKTMLTNGNQPVRLLGNIREVMQELYADPKWSKTMVGVSSRTDAPLWALELLRKFTIRYPDGQTFGKRTFTLQDVLEKKSTGADAEPLIEISYESKAKHFERLSQRTGVKFEDMLFLDNEYGNCEEISALGVTVVHCPGGVTSRQFESGLETFPSGDIVG